MAKRQRDWARKTRDKLMSLLGDKCAKCGTTIELQFDVITPVQDFDKTGKEKHQRAMDWSWRMSFYRKQFNNKNLQLLCDKHNSQKSNLENPF